MRLPPDNSTPMAFVRYGLYVMRRLRRAGLAALAEEAEKTTLDVKTAGRLWEDADEPILYATADRDAAADALALAAQTFRATLAARRLGADRQEPYTLIFPRGIGFYIAAPLDQEELRYRELRLRAREHLPEGDPARHEIEKAVDRGLKNFRQAVKEQQAAEAREALAGTHTRTAIASFSRQMEKTFGLLVAERGKNEAGLFFPKIRRAKSSPPEQGSQAAPSTPAPPASS